VQNVKRSPIVHLRISYTQVAGETTP